MVTTKLNVLHLHLVDSQAFPLVLPSAPLLSKGTQTRKIRLFCTQFTPVWMYFERLSVCQ